MSPPDPWRQPRGRRLASAVPHWRQAPLWSRPGSHMPGGLSGQGWEDLGEGCAPAEPGPWGCRVPLGRTWREGDQGEDGVHESGEGGAGDGAPDPLPHPPLLFLQPGQGARAAERCKQPKKMLPERHENEVNKRDKNGNIKTATSLLITKQAAGAGAGPQKQLCSRAGLIRDRQPGPGR